MGKKENPYPYFKISDCFILTSEYEGFPVIYMECLILNLPIITTDVSDSRKLIGNKYGIVVEKNVESIYSAMRERIANNIIKRSETFNCDEYNKIIKKKLFNLINGEKVKTETK